MFLAMFIDVTVRQSRFLSQYTDLRNWLGFLGHTIFVVSTS